MMINSELNKKSEPSSYMHTSMKQKNLVDRKRGSLFASRNSLRVQSNIPINPRLKRDTTKSRSLANIFALNSFKESSNKRTEDSYSINHRESFKSEASSKMLSEFIHGNVNISEVNSFKRRMEEAKTYESRINLYNTTKPPTNMSLLALPNALNTAFPNTQNSIKIKSSKSKIKISYGGADQSQNSSELERSKSISESIDVSKTHSTPNFKDFKSLVDPTCIDESTQDRGQTIENIQSSKVIEEAKSSSKTSSDEYKAANEKPLIVLTKIEDQKADSIPSQNEVLNVSNSEIDEYSPSGSPAIASTTKSNNVIELGVINEETSISQSASYHFSKSQNKDDSNETHTVSINKNDEVANLLSPYTSSPVYNKNKNLNRFKTKNDADIEMIHIVSELSHLSTSKKDLRDFDKELSKVSESSSHETIGSKNSKIKSNLKTVLKRHSKASSAVRVNNENSENDSQAKSISSVSCHSSINIDPDEMRPRNDNNLNKLKRTRTNMITISSLSNYKFHRPLKAGTKQQNELNDLNNESCSDSFTNKPEISPIQSPNVSQGINLEELNAKEENNMIKRSPPASPLIKKRNDNFQHYADHENKDIRVNPIEKMRGLSHANSGNN